jgi:hypothetical protein
MEQLMATMSTLGPEVLISWLDQEDVNAQLGMQEGMRGLVEGLAACSPAKAAAFVESLKLGKGRRLGISGVAEIWGQSDPATALAWARTWALHTLASKGWISMTASARACSTYSSEFDRRL